MPTQQPKYPWEAAFEVASVRQLLADPVLGGRVIPHLRPDRFPNPEAQLVTEVAMEVLAKTGRPPTSTGVLQGVRMRVESGKLPAQRLADAAAFIERGWEVEPVDSAQVQNLYLEEARHSAMWDALDDGLKRLPRRDWEGIAASTARAAAIGRVDSSVGTNIFKSLEERTENRRAGKRSKRFGTGIAELDDRLLGGLPEGALGVVVAPPKRGKCHAKGQGIMMWDGSIKKVEDIVEGDLLMGLGGSRRVLATNRGWGRMYDVKPNRGDSWRVNEDHVLTLKWSGAREGIGLVDVSVRDWLQWPASRKRRFKLLRASVDSFGGGEDNPLPLDPYFLGLLLGDGSFQHTCVGVTTADDEVVREVEKQAQLHGLRVRKAEKAGGTNKAATYLLSGRQGVSNPVMNKLFELGLRGKSCDDKFIPQAYLTACRGDRLQLLAGLVDTDGSVRKGGFEFVSKSRRLADGFAFIARSLGFSAYVHETQKGCQTGAVGTYWRLSMYGDGFQEVPTRLRRKESLFRKRRPRNTSCTGFTVEDVGPIDQPYYGFTLDGDGRYLLADFTVTHNSLFLGNIALHTALHGDSAWIYTMEIDEEIYTDRIDAAISRVPVDLLAEKADYVEEVVRAWFDDCGGSIIVKQFPSYSTTSADIEQHMQMLRAEHGISPGVLITDGGDFMAPRERQQRQDLDLGSIYSELRGIGVGWKVPVWTSSWAKSGASDKDIVGMGDVGESQRKVGVSDLGVTICSTQEEFDSGVLRLYVAWCRYAQGGFVLGPYKSGHREGRLLIDEVVDD